MAIDYKDPRVVMKICEKSAEKCTKDSLRWIMENSFDCQQMILKALPYWVQEAERLRAENEKLKTVVTATREYLKETDNHTYVHSLNMSGLHAVSMQVRQGEKGREWHQANWKMRELLAGLEG